MPRAQLIAELTAFYRAEDPAMVDKAEKLASGDITSLIKTLDMMYGKVPAGWTSAAASTPAAPPAAPAGAASAPQGGLTTERHESSVRTFHDNQTYTGEYGTRVLCVSPGCT